MRSVRLHENVGDALLYINIQPTIAPFKQLDAAYADVAR